MDAHRKLTQYMFAPLPFVNPRLKLCARARAILSHASDRCADLYGERTPFTGVEAWPERVDSQLVDKPDRWVQSACISCSIGCGVDIGVKDNKSEGVSHFAMRSLMCELT